MLPKYNRVVFIFVPSNGRTCVAGEECRSSRVALGPLVDQQTGEHGHISLRPGISYLCGSMGLMNSEGHALLRNELAQHIFEMSRLIPEPYQSSIRGGSLFGGGTDTHFLFDEARALEFSESQERLSGLNGDLEDSGFHGESDYGDTEKSGLDVTGITDEGDCRG